MQANAQLRKFMDFLYSENINQYVSLPEICSMGDTSSGKTSLMSALCGVELPSNAEITTRCPLRLRMEKSDEKKCEISIKWDLTSDYSSDTGWTLREVEGWDGLAKNITEAQQYIISLSQKEVASDVIEVSLYGPDCVNLTLIDTPGIVRTCGREEKETIVDDIQTLIRQRLQNERCVILPAVPANVDFHNSQIMADAKKVDPSTRRTIPVITKPDLIDRGAEFGVHDLLLNKKVEFQMGFHMVKCRGQKELDDAVSLEQGIEREKKFFQTKKPWSEESRRSLFGVGKLRDKLAKLQVRLVQQSVPDIMKEVQERQRHATTKRTALGVALVSESQKRELYSKSIHEAFQQIRNTLEGKFVKKTGVMTFQSQQHQRFKSFGNMVRGKRFANVSSVSKRSRVIVTLPNGQDARAIVVKICQEVGGMGVLARPFDSDYSEDGKNDSNSEAKEGTEDDSEQEISSDAEEFLKQGEDFQGTKKFHSDDVRSDIGWLKTLINNNRNDDLPCFLSSTLFTSIVADMIHTDIKPHCDELLEASTRALTEKLTSIFTEVFPGRFPQLIFFITTAIEELSILESNRAKETLAVLLENESHPYTQNHYLFENLSKLRNASLKRKLIRMVKNLDDVEGETITEIIESAFNQNDRLSMEDHVAMEMQHVLNAYGKVASKRIIDEVSMHIQELTRTMIEKLYSKLQIVSDGQLGAMMVESETFITEYQVLTEEIKAMDKTIRAFSRLQTGQF